MDRRSRRRKRSRTKPATQARPASWRGREQWSELPPQPFLGTFLADHSLLIQFGVNWVLLPIQAVLYCFLFGLHVGFVAVLWPLQWSIQTAIRVYFISWLHELCYPPLPHGLKYVDEK